MDLSQEEGPTRIRKEVGAFGLSLEGWEIIFIQGGKKKGPPRQNQNVYMETKRW